MNQRLSDIQRRVPLELYLFGQGEKYAMAHVPTDDRTVCLHDYTARLAVLDYRTLLAEWVQLN